MLLDTEESARIEVGNMKRSSNHKAALRRAAMVVVCGSAALSSSVSSFEMRRPDVFENLSAMCDVFSLLEEKIDNGETRDIGVVRNRT